MLRLGILGQAPRKTPQIGHGTLRLLDSGERSAPQSVMEQDESTLSAARAAGAARKRKAFDEVRRKGGTRIGFNAPAPIVAIIDAVKQTQRFKSRDDALCAIVDAYNRFVQEQEATKA